MGFKIHLNFPILVLFLLLISSSPAKALRRSTLPAHRRTLHGGAATAPFSPNKQTMDQNKKKKITPGFKRRRNSNNKNKPTAFSVMLPKGFVPPSGSSPCHNDNPQSLAFYCHLSASNP